MSSWVPATTTAALLSTPLVVIIFIVGHMAVTAPSVPCPTGCDCSEDKVGLLTAKCSLNSFRVDSAEDFFSIQLLSFNNSDTELPISLKDDMFQAFSGVTIIELSNCSVGYIYPGAFRGLKFLQELDLSNNHITHFHRTSFISTPKLSYLNLNNNPIEMTDLFLSSRSLQELRLESCSIQHIPAGAFKALPKLKSLSLYNNSLDTIPAHTMPKGLKRLNVAKNRIINIPTEVIYNLNRIRILDLSENLINCSCKLMGLQDWLSGRGVIFENDVLCASPAKYHGKSWTTVNEDEICDKEIKMTKELSNHVFGSSTSVDSDCDDLKGSCDELEEILQADQPLVKRTSEHELTPNDAPAGTEYPESASAAEETPDKSESEEENPKEPEADTAEVTKSDLQDIASDEEEKVVESTESIKSDAEEKAEAEENVTSEAEERSEPEVENVTTEAEDKETVNDEQSAGVTLADASSGSPAVENQNIESVSTEASLVPAKDEEPAEATPAIAEETPNVEEPVTESIGTSADGRSLDLLSTESPSSEEPTPIPEAGSASSSVSPAETDIDTSTEAKMEESETSVSPSSTVEPSVSSPVTVQDLGQEPETSSVGSSTEAAPTDSAPIETTENSLFSSSSESPSSSVSPSEEPSTPVPDFGLDVSSISSSLAPETTPSYTEVSSSVSPDSVDVSSTSETSVDVMSSSESPSTSEAPISSTSTESSPILGVGLEVSTEESSSPSSTPESVTPGLEVSSESPSSSEAPSSSETPSSASPILGDVQLEKDMSISRGASDSLEPPMISYDKVMTELKSNPGAYVLGGIVLVLAVLLLVALSRCRKAPSKRRLDINGKYDSDMNGGTELQEITSLIPPSMTNGTKIAKYSEKPSKDTQNLLSPDEKESNGVLIPLHGDSNGAATNGTSWSNGTKANGKSHNGTLKPEAPGSVTSVNNRGSQFFDDGVNPPIELTRVKVTMLPDSVPKTPVFVQRKFSDENS